MASQPSGYLPMKERPAPGDKLILVPVYVVPVEILERSIMHGLRYLYQVVIVDGYNGRTTLEDKKSVDPDTDFVPETDEQECLELKISPSRVSINERKIQVAWRIYAVRGKEIIDTFTGETIRSAGLAGMLFS